MSEDIGFDADIKEARRLDSFRTQAIEMRRQGLEGLSQNQYKKNNSNTKWREPGDYVEKAELIYTLFRENPDILKRFASQLKEMEDFNIDKVFKVYNFLDATGDHVPVLRAATVLNTLATIPGSALSLGAFSSYFRIIYELNSASKPDEMIGSASAGAPDVPQNA
jgi:hypothetical protein